MKGAAIGMAQADNKDDITEHDHGYQGLSPLGTLYITSLPLLLFLLLLVLLQGEYFDDDEGYDDLGDDGGDDGPVY